MKKVLLGSTALVAAGLIAGHAEAADGVKLSLGGYYRGVAGLMFDDFDGAAAGLEDDLRDYVFKQDVEVHFKGETTLDNGLTVGANIQLEGQTSGDQIDEVYAYFSGGWGELRFGDDDEALAQLCSITPSAASNFGPDSPFFSFSNSGLTGYAGTNGTCYGTDSDSTKLIYFSPNFGGFSFAMSFTPDNTQDTRNTLSGAGTRFENNLGQNSDNLSVAANFNHDFNGVTLNVGGGATWSFDREGAPGVDETEDYQTYASVSFFGFTIGGAAEWRYNFGGDESDRMVYGAGVTYNWDAWTVGLGWTHGDYEVVQSGVNVGTTTTPIITTSDVDQNQDIFALTAAYALGPGITVDGVVEWVDSDVNGLGTNADYQGVSFGLGTLISF
jgi:predicted porin